MESPVYSLKIHLLLKEIFITTVNRKNNTISIKNNSNESSDIELWLGVAASAKTLSEGLISHMFSVKDILP